jgi:hypothetical protein
MSNNLTSIKDRLFALGVSTCTTGLGGAERAAELQRRLDIADAGVMQLSVLDSLSMNEIRTRLNDLGESTSTPGVLGDERRAALIARLIEALKTSDARTHERLIPESTQQMLRNQGKAHDAEVNGITRVEMTRTVHSPLKTQPPTIDYSDIFATNFQDLNENYGLEPLSLPERYRGLTRAELRREVKAVQNKRAAEFAGRLAGPSQDLRLRDCSRLATKLGTEQTRLKEARRTTRFASSLLVNGGAMMAIDDQLSILEQTRTEVREQVRVLQNCRNLYLTDTYFR